VVVSTVDSAVVDGIGIAIYLIYVRPLSTILLAFQVPDVAVDDFVCWPQLPGAALAPSLFELSPAEITRTSLWDIRNSSLCSTNLSWSRNKFGKLRQRCPFEFAAVFAAADMHIIPLSIQSFTAFTNLHKMHVRRLKHAKTKVKKVKFQLDFTAGIFIALL